MTGSRGKSSVACNRCRRLKVKCSGGDPCDGCRKKNLSCVYSSSRINNYNPQKFERLFTDRKIIRTPGVNESQARETFNKAVSTSCERLKDKRSSAGAMFNSVPSLEHGWPSAYTHGWVRYQNLLLISLCENNRSELSEECQSKLRSPPPQFYGWNMSGVHYLKRKNFPRKPDADFSEKHEALIKFFFEEINPLVGILGSYFFDYVISGSVTSQVDSSSSNTGSKIKAAMDEERDNDKENLIYAILYLVYAISIRFVEFDRNEGPRKEMLALEESCFRFSYEVIDILSFEKLSLELLQAWLLITFYLRTTQRRISLIVALDRANCMAANIGLHLESMNDLFKDERKNNKAKHLFWCLYTFDRLISLQIGKSSFWRNGEITLPFPESYNEFASDRCFLILSFAMLKLALLAEDVERVSNTFVPKNEKVEVQREVDALELWLAENRICREALYDSTRDPNLRPLLSVQVLMQFCDIKLCLQGPMLFDSIERKVPSFGLDFQSIISCSRKIVEYGEFLRNEDLLKQPWYLTLLSLFTAGTCTLAIINGGTWMNEAIHLFSRITLLISSLCSFGSSKPKRFKMAEECLSALLRGREIILLRLKQSTGLLESSTMELKSISASLKENNINKSKEDNSHGVLNCGSQDVPQPLDSYFNYSDELDNLFSGNLVDNLDFLDEPLGGITDNFYF